ncbi:MAG TPA: hypothetical protein VKA26_02390 [Ignavibacteriaceae bacterium]|nr:hypothetical protein [Ignavibacteriaceae bacterium]
MCQKLFSSAAILVLAVLVFSVSGVAQTPSNVEKATRFRVNTEATTLNSTSATEVNINDVSNANFRIFVNKSTSQLEAIGSRYGWATSNNQLSELGSRYGWATSNNQLSKLGSRYGWATSNTQLN